MTSNKTRKISRTRWIARRSSQALSIFCVASLVFLMVHGGLENRLSIKDADDGGALFLFAVLVYRGSPFIWWSFFVPLCSIALLAPVASLEMAGASSVGELLRAAIAPGVSLIIGFLVSAIRDTQAESTGAREELEALGKKGRDLTIDVQNLERDLKHILSDRLTSNNSLTNQFQFTQDTGDIEADLKASGIHLETTQFGSTNSALTPAEIITHGELHSLVAETLEEIQSKQTSRSPIRFSLTASKEQTLPVAVRGDEEQIRICVRSLLNQSVDALGGASGFVRVTLHPTISAMRLIIEDNGRGLGESHLARLSSRGHATLEGATLTVPEIRRFVEGIGGRFDIHSRLGVGSRSSIELARVDSFAHAERNVGRSARDSRVAFANSNSELQLS